MAVLKLTHEIRDAIDRWDGRLGPPAAENRKTNRLRVFVSAFVERVFATSHPLLPGVWFGGIIAYGAVVPFINASVGVARGVGLYALGLLVWTLTEYVLHRFVFHLRPGPTDSSKVRQFMMHGYHHEFPNDRMRLVAPPLMSWPLAAVFALIYRGLLGPGLWWPAFGGTVAGYLAYDWIHYYTHHFTPTTAMGKALRRNHMVHHYSNSEANHGISSPLWDFIFRSYQGPTRGARGAAETRDADPS
jgi:hypothetical protein